MATATSSGQAQIDEVISTYTELCLIDQYIGLEKSEAAHFRKLGNILKDYPLWTDFLEGVKGVGPAMAGVIISEIDIHRAKYPSSLWAYAGLDVVAGWEIDHIQPVSGTISRELMETIPTSRPLKGDDVAINGEQFTLSDGGRILTVRHQWDDRPECCEVVYKFSEHGGRSKRKEHLVEREYTDRDGKPAKRMGITFNPFLKTKLVGVLASSFVKQKDSPYRDIYDDYKHRLESHAKYGKHLDDQKDEKTGFKKSSKGRRHNMALRYTIKMFLIELYKFWRALEGLEVHPPYQEAKLGHSHREVA